MTTLFVFRRKEHNMANITKRVSKKGDVSYRIKAFFGYDKNGKQITRSMTWKPEPGMSERQIRKALDREALIFEESANLNPKNSRRVKFRELSEEWLSLMESTGEMKRSTIERIKGLTPRTYKWLGNQYVDDISYRTIQQFIISLSKPGTNERTGGSLSEKTQKHYISFVSDVMRYALKCGIVTSNPCHDISVVRTGKKEKAVYTIEEEAQQQDLMSRDDIPIKYRAFFELAVYCGFRRGELMGFEWKDIDFTDGTIFVQRTSNYRSSATGTYTDTPKTKESTRYVALPKPVTETLLKLREELDLQKAVCGDQWTETDRLFVQWNGLPMHPNTPYNYLQHLYERNGIPFKGIHSFRHAFATNLIASNRVDIKTVSSLLGHSQASTTLNIYAHEVRKASARGINIYADILQNARNNDQK